ncbi:MAG: hypothetical protein ACE5MB_05385 [Anaerolineae bacterium]
MALASTITLELPDALRQKLRDYRVSEKQLQAVLLEAIEVWPEYQRQVAELAEASPRRPAGRFSQSAVPFARLLIDRNRALFEELAQR